MSRPHINRSLLGVIAIVLLTILSYGAAGHGGFVWDDDRYVTQNRLLTAPDGLWRIWFSLDAPSQYFPLTYTLFRFEHALFGLNPAGYHWVNILIHALNALLVWRVLSRLRIPGAWFTAAIWAVHPVQVESVAWISELKNVLMGFFFLLTIWMWIEYVDSNAKRRPVFYIAALSFYFFALSAKATACTLPAALILILWLRQTPINRRVWLEIAPFVLLALGVGLLTVWWEKYHQGTRVLVSIPALDRLLIASRAIWFYLSKIFWPSDLIFIYPQWKIHWDSPVDYVPLLALVLAAVAIYLTRHRLGRAIEVAMLFFITTLAPLLGFIMLFTFRYTFVADHYQYLASIGPIALVTAGLTTIGAQAKPAPSLVVAVGVAILGCLAVLTWRQSQNYRDLETLWRATIARNPRCWMAYNNLGIVQFEKGNTDDAIDQYEQCLRLNPDYPEARYNLGSAFLQKGEIDKAIQECQRAIGLQPAEPDAHVVLGNALLAKGDTDGAINEYKRALTFRSDDSDAHYNLGVALKQKGESDAAQVEFDKARQFESRQKP